jgi:DNA mismatch repair protein MutS
VKTATTPGDIVTAAMKTYERTKKTHPDCVLLFRIGDFYEMFHDDARTASKTLGLTLMTKPSGIALAGIPFDMLETYLRRMIAAGLKVAVCDPVVK